MTTQEESAERQQQKQHDEIRIRTRASYQEQLHKALRGETSYTDTSDLAALEEHDEKLTLQVLSKVSTFIDELKSVTYGSDNGGGMWIFDTEVELAFKSVEALLCDFKPEANGPEVTALRAFRARLYDRLVARGART